MSNDRYGVLSTSRVLENADQYFSREFFWSFMSNGRVRELVELRRDSRIKA